MARGEPRGAGDALGARDLGAWRREGDPTVLVLRFRLDPARDRLDRFESTLSPDERARAAKFVFDVHRGRFVAGRGTVREVLAGVLGVEPAALRFRYGAQGKPELALDAGEPPLSFNLSHSDDVAVLAIAHGARLGVDVERIRDEIDLHGLARQCFSPDERAGLAAVAPDRAASTFFLCWTRKEAFVKALGRGFDYPLATFSVLDRAGAPRLGITIEGAGAAEPWTVIDLRAERGYAAALVVEGADREVRCARWDCC